MKKIILLISLITISSCSASETMTTEDIAVLHLLRSITPNCPLTNNIFVQELSHDECETSFFKIQNYLLSLNSTEISAKRFGIFKEHAPLLTLRLKAIIDKQLRALARHLKELKQQGHQRSHNFILPLRYTPPIQSDVPWETVQQWRKINSL